MKRYIRAMSLDKDKAMKQSKSFSPIILEHIIKLLVYSNMRPNDINGWLNTIAKWIHRADDITIKPYAKKLKSQDIEASLFSCMGDELSDYRRALYAFQADNLTGKFNYGDKIPYPEFDIDDDLAEDLMNICYDVIDATMPLLQDKKDHSKDEYLEVIKPIFEAIS